MEDEPQGAYLPDERGEPLQPFDVQAQSTRAGLIKLLMGLGFLLLLALVVMKLFSAGTRDRDQLPRITADNTPYKEVPLNPGGADAQTKDKEIYDVLKGDDTGTEVKTVPVSEEPLEPPRPARPAANVVIKEKPEQAKPTPKPSATPKQPSKLYKPDIRLKSGPYVVQVASLRSQKAADDLWAKLRARPELNLQGEYYANIKRVDLGTRGVYYRLRIDGVGDLQAAKALCANLKAHKQGCIVTRK